MFFYIYIKFCYCYIPQFEYIKKLMNDQSFIEQCLMIVYSNAKFLLSVFIC